MNLQDSPFFKQADLMIECLPLVFEEECFALKGGTAINLFFRDLPRLSVDIDLVYLPIEEYEQSQLHISRALNRIAKNLELRIPKSRALLTKVKGQELTQKINLQFGKISVVIEPNLVIRGCLDEITRCALTQKAQNLFQKNVKVPILSENEVYAGKFCAGFERQHPRDLFDIKLFLEKNEVTSKLKKLLIAYLLCSGRPMHEILFPTLKDFSLTYEREFKLMTTHPFSLSDLLKSRESSFHLVQKSLNSEDKEFIVSFCEGSPNWNLLGLDKAENFPGLQWKQKNIQLLKKTNPLKHKTQIKDLSEKLEVP